MLGCGVACFTGGCVEETFRYNVAWRRELNFKKGQDLPYLSLTNGPKHQHFKFQHGPEKQVFKGRIPVKNMVTAIVLEQFFRTNISNYPPVLAYLPER